jgi:hypothetical protein
VGWPAHGRSSQKQAGRSRRSLPPDRQGEPRLGRQRYFEFTSRRKLPISNVPKDFRHGPVVSVGIATYEWRRSRVPVPLPFTLPTLEHASWANSERSPCEFMRGLPWLVRNLNPSDQISTRRSGSDSDKITPVVKKSTSRMLFALILHCDSSVILPPLPLKISGRV